MKIEWELNWSSLIIPSILNYNTNSASSAIESRILYAFISVFPHTNLLWTQRVILLAPVIDIRGTVILWRTQWKLWMSISLFKVWIFKWIQQGQMVGELSLWAVHLSDRTTAFEVVICQPVDCEMRTHTAHHRHNSHNSVGPCAPRTICHVLSHTTSLQFTEWLQRLCFISILMCNLEFFLSKSSHNPTKDCETQGSGNRGRRWA